MHAAVLHLRVIIEEWGETLGHRRRCSCCNRPTLYLVPCDGIEGGYIVCRFCDTDLG